MSNNPQIIKYKPVIENLIQHNRIAIFSKYSDEIEENNIYTPPIWNQDKRNKIIDLIQNMTFKTIPQGLFNDSSSTEVREQMSKAFEILKSKASDLLKIAISQALQNKLIIRATELEIFVKFIEEKVICNALNTGLTDYIKHLDHHNFLKVLMSEDIQKLGQELEFLAPFTKAHHQCRQVKENWGNIVNSNSLFKDILYEAKIIIHEADELFSAFVEKARIIIVGCFGENSIKLKTLFTDLFNAYKNKANIESNKNDDKYYFDDTEKKFIGFQQEPYTKGVPYEDVEYYTERELVDRCSRSSKSEQDCKARLPEPDTWVLRVTNTYEKPIHLGLVYTMKYYDFECSQYKDIVKTRPIIKNKTVTKHKDVPQYQDVKVKKFDETKYNQDLKNADVTISDINDKVSDVLSQIKAINLAKKCNLPLSLTDKIENYAKNQYFIDQAEHNEIRAKFSNLNDEWKYLEYEAQALSEYEPEIIGNSS